ncbi:MAG: signal peptide peptidase SppA [Pseudomonadota bacterium]
MATLKRIVVRLLATIGALFVLSLIGIAASAWYLSRSEPGLPDRMVVTLDLRNGIAEVASDPLATLGIDREPTLTQVVLALHAASKDERVVGLLVRLDGQGPGFAQIQDLRDAVMEFGARDKQTVAHSDSFGEFGPGNSGYYLASVFDQIELQPMGSVGLTGLYLETPLARGLLDKIGVEPSGDRRGAYKTIYDTFFETSMTPAHEESLQSLASSLDEQFQGGIAEGRGLDGAKVSDLIDGGPYMAQEALDLGLVDQLRYWHDAVEAMRDLAGPDGDLVGLLDYASTIETDSEAPVVALVHGVGQIQRGNSEQGPIGGWVMGSDTVARALSNAIDADEVEAVLFRISSGGGSAVASDTIAHQVRRAVEADKPVIVSMGDVAASGGYWIAMDATKIVAQPGTLTGSIGVVAGKPVLDKLYRELGVAWGHAQRGTNANMWTTTENYTASGRARLEAFLDTTYNAFTEGVARGRDLPEDDVEKIAQGRVWTGAQAKEHGLVDQLGGLASALTLVREEIGVSPEAPLRLRRFPAPRSLWEQALQLIGNVQTRFSSLEGWLARSFPGSLSAPTIMVR